MILDRVTFTGADDSVDPQELVRLSDRFPFVEWGILFSRARLGSPRYPSQTWLTVLRHCVEDRSLKLSAHLCGRWVRDFVISARFTWLQEFPTLAPLFQRVQLNFHGEYHQRGAGFETMLLAHSEREATTTRPAQPGKRFIFQCDGVNDEVVRDLATWGCAVPLFDTSGGAGVVPNGWPPSWPGIYCGYAGGLSPDNVLEELKRIEGAAGPERVWIDMERRVRSEDDTKFDIAKVHRVLEQVAPMVKA